LKGWAKLFRRTLWDSIYWTKLAKDERLGREIW